MKNEEQHNELLRPINKDSVDDQIRRTRYPCSLVGFLQRVIDMWRTARIKRVLKTLGTHRKQRFMISMGETKLEPLWVTMPGYPMRSMAWRMGGGEDAAVKFLKQYRALSNSSKENFRRQYPEPEGWKGYYFGIHDHSHDRN